MSGPLIVRKISAAATIVSSFLGRGTWRATERPADDAESHVLRLVTRQTVVFRLKRRILFFIDRVPPLPPRQLLFGKLGNQAQRHRQAFQLVMWPQEEVRG